MSPKATDTGVLEAAVAGLEKLTPDAIAEEMVKAGIGGRPGTVSQCPLANLMRSKWGGRFVVGPKFVARQCGRRLEKIPTPSALRQFIRAFDLSQYPKLIMPPPRVLGPKRKRNKGPATKRKRGPVVNRPAILVGRW